MTSSVVARPPCFRALPRVFILPASVLGPVLLAAFRLFAAICASVAMGASPGEAATTRPGAWAQRPRCAVVASTYRRSRILGLQLHQSAKDRRFCPRGGPAIRRNRRGRKGMGGEPRPPGSWKKSAGRGRRGPRVGSEGPRPPSRLVASGTA